MPSKYPGKKHINIHLTADEYGQLQDLAFSDKRSLKNFVELIVSRYLRTMQARGGKKPDENDKSLFR